MRKPIVPRFLLLLVLYAVIFVVLVYIQFAHTTAFTRRTANLVVQGNYGKAPPDKALAPGMIPLEGPVSVFFGGMEFLVGKAELVLAGRALHPQWMMLTDNEVYFYFSKESLELVFTTQYSGGAVELVIRADFLGGSSPGSGVETETVEPAVYLTEIKLPFMPLATSAVQGGSRFLLNAGGTVYTFNRDTGNEYLVLETANPAISYRAVQERTINPGDFIVPAARDMESYEKSLALWLDQSYSLWNRTISRSSESPPDEGEILCAYMSEALKRGTYRASAGAAAVYSAALPGASVSWEASPYTGRLEAALRLLSAAERERSARLARLFNEKSAEVFREFRLVEYLASRGYNNFMDDAAELLRSFDPAAMTVEQAAGFLEGCIDWSRFRPGAYNPYNRFVDQALFLITGNLHKDPNLGHALVFGSRDGDRNAVQTASGDADAELNLRLGAALVRYDDETNRALGRTLILSVLSLADNSGAVPRKITKRGSGAFDSGNRIPALGSGRIYRICFAGEYYARAQTPGGGIWAWSAALQISAATVAGRLDLTVQFPAGETHYMMIRGVRPFTALQINNVPVNADSQFERYDSSGWIYSPAEQTLLVKMRHRQTAERISLIY